MDGWQVRRAGASAGRWQHASLREDYLNDLDERELVAGHVFLGQDGVDRALGDAHRAVDALVGIDGQEIRALAEAIDRANIDAIGVLAADARFGDDVGHGRTNG
jgi:hypothetical protein